MIEEEKIKLLDLMNTFEVEFKDKFRKLKIEMFEVLEK